MLAGSLPAADSNFLFVHTPPSAFMTTSVGVALVHSRFANWNFRGFARVDRLGAVKALLQGLLCFLLLFVGVISRSKA